MVKTANHINRINLVDQWPIFLNQDQTVSGLSTPSIVGRLQGQNYWGLMVKTESMETFSWTKLLLGEGLKTSEFNEPALSDALNLGIFDLPEGKSPEDVVTQYLREVYQHMHKWIMQNYFPELDTTPIEFWITVPAVWSDKATAATRRVARFAGFGQRQQDSLSVLVTEPEAAAMGVLSQSEYAHSAKVCGNVGQLEVRLTW